MLWCATWMLFVLQDTPWCAKCMFVFNMKYALVCKIDVCMYYEICFGVQNERLYVL